MEQSPAARLVDALARLGYRTQQQIADVLEIARPTAGTIVRQEKDPSFAAVARLKARHPELNTDWVFTGAGSAILSEPGMPPMPATPPAATTGPAAEQMDTVAILRLLEMHRNELAEVRKEYRAALLEAVEAKNEALRLDAERHARDMAAQERFIKSLQEEIFWLKGQMGLRPQTPAEKAAAKKQAAAAPPRAGFKPGNVMMYVNRAA